HAAPKGNADPGRRFLLDGYGRYLLSPQHRRKSLRVVRESFSVDVLVGAGVPTAKYVNWHAVPLPYLPARWANGGGNHSHSPMDKILQFVLIGRLQCCFFYADLPGQCQLSE